MTTRGIILLSLAVSLPVSLGMETLIRRWTSVPIRSIDFHIGPVDSSLHHLLVVEAWPVGCRSLRLTGPVTGATTMPPVRARWTPKDCASQRRQVVKR